MSAGSRKKRQSTASQTMGGVVFTFEQQVMRAASLPGELVPQAGLEATIASGDGDLLTVDVPAAPELDDPWAGIEDELAGDDDPWADYSTETETTGA